MWRLYLSLALTLGLAVPVIAAEEDTFKACTNDADCLFVQGECGVWESVNRAHKESAEAFYKARQKPLLCEWTQQPEPKQAECRNGKCAIRGQ